MEIEKQRSYYQIPCAVDTLVYFHGNRGSLHPVVLEEYVSERKEKKKKKKKKKRKDNARYEDKGTK